MQLRAALTELLFLMKTETRRTSNVITSVTGATKIHAERASRWMNSTQLRVAVVQLGLLLFACLTYIIVQGVFLTNNPLLPSPSAILQAIIRGLDSGLFLRALSSTGWIVLVGTAGSLVLALPIGFVIGRNSSFYDATKPILLALFAVPYFVIYPVLVLLLGIGDAPLYVLAIVSGVFPMLLYVVTAVRQIPVAWVNLASTYGYPRRATIFKVQVPAALPMFLAGLRVTTGLVIVGVVIGEFILSQRGLGYTLQYESQLFAYPVVYGLVLTSWIVVLFLVLSLQLWEEHVRAWNRP